MTVTASSDLLGQYERSLSASTGGTDRIAKEKNTFLKLLIAQLNHQDPLNPTEDKEFIAQLAQFSSVEELQKINKSVENLTEKQSQQHITNAASLLGKHAFAKGDTITKTANNVSTLQALFSESIAGGTVNIHATNEDGSIAHIVRSIKLGPRPAGTEPIRWDGKNNEGKEMPTGTYIVSIAAKRSNGSNLLVDCESEGIVAGVKASADGNHELYLHDWRTVRLSDVKHITVPLQTENPTDKEETEPQETGKKQAGKQQA